jgi:enoyl-CoA hydratase/carnithine racemase
VASGYRCPIDIKVISMLRSHLDPDTGTLTLTLARPPVNALNEALYDQLHASFEMARDDDSVRAVVLAALGEKAFCAGADVKEYVGLPHDQADVKQLTFLLRCLLDVVNCPKPVVAAVTAPAIGAGLMLACACDEVVLAQNAWVGLPESKLNLPTPIGAAIAARRFEPRAVHTLVQRAERLNAHQCLAAGFADQVVPANEVMPTVVQRLTAYTDINAVVYAINKRWLNRDLPQILQASCDHVSLSPDSQ